MGLLFLLLVTHILLLLLTESLQLLEYNLFTYRTLLDRVHFFPGKVYVSSEPSMDELPTTSASSQPGCLSDNNVWYELESDPGLFTLLLSNMGVSDVEVEEVYDINTPYSVSDVFGFIFLFKCASKRGRKNRKKAEQMDKFIEDIKENAQVKDEDIVNNKLFFAHQIIVNSCATHALLSIVLNRTDVVDIGSGLQGYVEATRGLSPEEKGSAIQTLSFLSEAHNRHASSSVKREGLSEPNATGGSGAVVDDVFHYSCFVPIDNNLYELDGCMDFPVSYGPIPPGSTWIEHFRQTIAQRIELSSSYDDEIRYNLLALCRCRTSVIEGKISRLNANLAAFRHSLPTCTIGFKDGDSSISVGHDNLAVVTNAFETGRLVDVSLSLTDNALQHINNKKTVDEFEILDLSPESKQGECDLNIYVDGCESVICLKVLHLIPYPSGGAFWKAAKDAAASLSAQLTDAKARRREMEAEDERRSFNYEPFFRLYLHKLIDHSLVSNEELSLPPRTQRGRKKKT